MTSSSSGAVSCSGVRFYWYRWVTCYSGGRSPGVDLWRLFGYLYCLTVFLAENPRDLGGIYCLLGGAGAFFCVPQTPLFWVFTVFLAVFAPGVLKTKCGFPIFGRSTIRSFLFLGDRLRLGTSINTELNY